MDTRPPAPTTSRVSTASSPSRPPGDLADAFIEEPELILACLQDAEQGPSSSVKLVLEAAQAGLERSPEQADLLYYASQAAVAGGENGTAATLLEQALRVNPAYKDALILTARVWLKGGDWKRARAWLETALSKGADYPDVHMLMGKLQEQQRNWGGARAAYQRALEANPNLTAARAALAALPASETSSNDHDLPA